MIKYADMRNKRKWIALALAFAMVFCLAGCDTYNNFKKAFLEKDTEEAIRFGVFEPLSGSDAEAAKAEIGGIELAHELFPSVNGVNVELVYEDNQSDAELAAAAAAKLCESNVSLILGSYNNVLTLAGGDYFEEAHIPAITATNSNPLITKTNDYYFRVCTVEAYQGVSAADYLFHSMGRGRVVAFKMEGDDYAATMIEQFENKMIELTGSDDSVIIVEYPENGEDYAAYVQILASAGRSTVFFPSKANAAAKMIQAAADLGYRLDWIGPSRWADLPDYTDSAECLEGVAYVTDYDPDAQLSNMAETFRNAWSAKYGADNLPTKEAALGFDAYLLAVQAIRVSGGDLKGPMLRKYLTGIQNMPGATGMLTMNAEGDPTTDVVIAQYHDGTPGAIYTITSVEKTIGE